MSRILSCPLVDRCSKVRDACHTLKYAWGGGYIQHLSALQCPIYRTYLASKRDFKSFFEKGLRKTPNPTFGDCKLCAKETVCPDAYQIGKMTCRKFEQK